MSRHGGPGLARVGWACHSPHVRLAISISALATATLAFAAPDPQPLHQSLYLYCQNWLVEDLLMKADKMTMANSIELRVPFLTNSFVDWAQRLPVALRVGDNTRGYSSKRILRQFAVEMLPREIIDRPKQGFPVPAYQWLRGELGQWACQRLADTGSPMYEWLDPRVALASAQAAQAGDAEAAHLTWALLVLDTWTRRWL